MKNKQAKVMRERLIKACDKHLKTGGTIAKGHFCGINNDYCPITCLIGPGYVNEMESRLTKKLKFKVTYDDIWDLIGAFDGSSMALGQSTTSLAAKIGFALRKRYVK